MDRTLFDPIIGHSRLKEQFARLIDEDRIPHAMIFAGPAGIGKTLMAIAVASALVGRRVFPDLASREGEAVAGDKDDAFYLAPMGAMLKVDQFRQLQGELALQGETGRRRVCIIDHVETMNTEFANRMLKILEEPPSGVCFILITDQPDLLLPTIISRCARFTFDPVGDDEMRQGLRRLRGDGGIGTKPSSGVAASSGLYCPISTARGRIRPISPWIFDDYGETCLSLCQMAGPVRGADG